MLMSSLVSGLQSENVYYYIHVHISMGFTQSHLKYMCVTHTTYSVIHQSIQIINLTNHAIWKQRMKLDIKSVWTIHPSTINFVLPFSTFDLP